mgnify:CR=1 FL=1|jgi:lipoate-protein ligase A
MPTAASSELMAETERLSSWRFIDSGPMTGRQNMAIDLALAEHAARPAARAVLRLYSWKPPAISLGYHQSLAEIDRERCLADQIDIVVRPTGGRAVLHADELTYAVIIPQHDPCYDDRILTVYERISRSLLAAFRNLDVAVEFERAEKAATDFSRGELAALCYAGSVQYEILHHGRKLVGSAQRRLDGVVLQHGSILLGPRHLDLPYYLSRMDDNRRAAVRSYLERRTITLNELSKRPVTYERLAQAMRCGFSAELKAEMVAEPLTAAEQQTAQRLLQSAGDRQSAENRQ